MYDMDECDEILLIAEDIKMLLNTVASANEVNNEIEELKRFVEQ